MLEGIYNKENIYAEFAMQKTKAKKVKFLKEMRALKDTQPSLFKDLSISKKQFDNLIIEWDGEELEGWNKYSELKSKVKSKKTKKK